MLEVKEPLRCVTEMDISGRKRKVAEIHFSGNYLIICKKKKKKKQNGVASMSNDKIDSFNSLYTTYMEWLHVLFSKFSNVK